MSEKMDESRLCAEGELALARFALDEGDLPHAAAHLAEALTYAPTLPEVHEVLARIAARANGGIDLFPLERHAFVGVVVARAHLLAAAKHPLEGLELLAAATAHAPGVNWAGVPWVTTPDLADRTDPDGIVRVLMQLCAVIPDPAPTPVRASLVPYLAMAGNAVARHPTHGLLLGVASALARRLGQFDLAVRWARQSVLLAPSKLGEVWLGYAQRSAGRIEEALAALHRAVAHDPSDLAVYADIAGTLADHGRLDEALTWIDRALARDPSFDCAVHTGHRLRYRRDGEVGHLVALADFVREHPDDSHEHNDLAECCEGKPWLSQVPTANEAVAEVLRQVLATDKPVAGGELRLSRLEPPSAMLTATGALPGLAVTVTAVPTPDIRMPRRLTQYPLWRYTGTTVTPALAPPSAEAVRQIRYLAHPVWPHPVAAYDAAVALATLSVDDLLALLVHPPEASAATLCHTLAQRDPSLWVRCVQVWACLGLLHHRTEEEWAVSTRRRVLVDLVWGVEDWITEAALFALISAAWVEPSVRADVADIVADRFTDGLVVARHRPVSIMPSLARLALVTPALDARVAAAAQTLLGEKTIVPSPRRRNRWRDMSLGVWRRFTSAC